MRRRSASVWLAAAVAVVLLAGCNRGQDPAVETSGTDPTTTTAPTSTAPPITSATPPVSTPAGTERAYLTAVRVDTKDDGASRVVFEFAAGLPGYKVAFAERPVTMDGSGDEVRVAGEAVLEIVMENAAQARFEGERVIQTYTGPRRLQPSGAGAGTGAVAEVVEAGDFEGLVRWVVGVRQEDSKVAVSTLSAPSRLVVDFTPS